MPTCELLPASSCLAGTSRLLATRETLTTVRGNVYSSWHRFFGACRGGSLHPARGWAAGRRSRAVTEDAASGGQGSRVNGRRAVEGPQAARQERTPDPHAQAALATAIAEAVRDRDERVLRRLLARFAEQAAITDLPALRDALDTTRQHSDRPSGAR